MGTYSHLAGAIITSITQQTARELSWLSMRGRDLDSPARPADSSPMLVIEQERSHQISIPANNLRWHYGWLHTIKISLQTNRLQSETIA